MDTWFSVDRMTGSKKGAISVHGCAKFDECPNASPHTDFLIGRTEYSIMMYDSRNVNGNMAGRKNNVGKSWNITFYDYSSSLGGSDVGPDYGRHRLPCFICQKLKTKEENFDADFKYLQSVLHFETHTIILLFRSLLNKMPYHLCTYNCYVTVRFPSIKAECGSKLPAAIFLSNPCWLPALPVRKQ